MVKKQKLVIENEAKLHLRELYNYIKSDSPLNAARVKKELMASFKDLLKYPESHPPDKYKIKNDGNFRAYELYKYRVSYHVSNEQISILRIRHTKMNP